MIQLLSKNEQDICLYEMRSDELTVLISSYGVTIVEIEMEDRHHHRDSIVLGYPTLEDYQARSGTYFGATVGRVCNRIAGGAFTLNGKPYTLAVNNGPNSLHGGIEGFSYKNFDSKITGEDSLLFFYHSPDMEEGYPGNLDVSVEVSLKGNTLTMQFAASCDQDTLLNLTNHTYFNLSGGKRDILDHEMQICASRFGCVNADGLATGQFRELAASPFQFSELKTIGSALDFEDEQVSNANGIDHHFVFNPDCEQEQLTLYDKESGRKVTLTTTLPGVQIYTGNYIEPCQGRRDNQYDKRWGVAVEPQKMPDSIHNQGNPEVILKAGETFEESISYTFTIE